MRLYQDSDYNMILEWCFIRGIRHPEKWQLPETGIVVDDIAVGFLVLTNNHCAILDFYFSSPLSDKKLRDGALDELTEELLELAARNGVKKVFCGSDKDPIKKRAIKHGFDFLGSFSFFEKGC